MPALRLLAMGLLILPISAAGRAAPKHNPAAAKSWATYKNPRFGYSLYYPAALFQTAPASDDDGGQTFTTSDGRAKIVVSGTLNSENLSPQDYRKVILKDFGGYDRLEYSPVGGTWFVLSGFRGDNIYYQKVMFSCRNKVINAMSITFPTAEKPIYEWVVEIMEDHFKSGSGEATPSGC